MTTDNEDRDVDDGCECDCLPCRFRLMVSDMKDVRDRLRRGRKTEAMNLLCVVIADAEAYLTSDEFADEVEGWADEDDDLAGMVPAGRA